MKNLSDKAIEIINGMDGIGGIPNEREFLLEFLSRFNPDFLEEETIRRREYKGFMKQHRRLWQSVELKGRFKYIVETSVRRTVHGWQITKKTPVNTIKSGRYFNTHEEAIDFATR